MAGARRALLASALATAALAVALPRAAADPAPAYPTDEHGFVGTAARCADGQTLMELGRTARALVAICVDADGALEYRGVRISDQASLSMPASRGADQAVVVTNDDVTYSVSKEAFLVSEGDTVLYRDSWVEFRAPRFPAAPAASATQTAAPTSPVTSAPPTTSVTVSTTTVTPKPSSQTTSADG